MKVLFHITVFILMLTVPHYVIPQTGAGYPEWPLILRHSNNGLSNQVQNQMLDFKPSFMVSPPSGSTNAVITGQSSSDYGPSAAAYNNCGEMVFYLNHTGTFLPTTGAGLKIVSPSGTEITSSANRMDCSPMDNEVQILLMSGYTDRWMIIYNRNFDPASGTFTNAKTRYLQVLYSIVTYDGTTLTYISKDVALNGVATTYHDYAKALSIEYNVPVEGGTEARRYLYLKRASTRTIQDPALASDIYIEQFTITPNGILMTTGSNPRILFYTVSKGFSAVEDFGAPIELNETNGEIRLATMMCYNGTAGNTSSVGSRFLYSKYTNHEDFNSITAEIVQCADLALIPSDNTSDTWNLNYHTAGWGGTYRQPKSFISGFLILQTYLSNFHRGLYHIEFSPNGRFLYVTGGGYSVANTSFMTYLGQVDLSQKVLVGSPLTNQYTLRLKVQEVSGFALGSNNYKYYGRGASYTNITDAAYINFKGINVTEKAPNSKLYFTKLNSRELFCINDPDQVFTNIDFIPLNVLNGYSNNLTILSDPTYTTNNTIAGMLPDACDQNNYTTLLAGCEAVIPCANCIGSFAPEANGTTPYILSTWVHDPNYSPTMTTFTDPQVYIAFTSSTGTITTIGPFVGSGKIIDGWQKLETQFTVPAGSVNIQIKLQCASGDCNFDDIRINPFNGSMRTYVYDPVTLLLVAQQDERNYTTYYEYDEEGTLTRVKKETEKGILTIQETKAAKKKH